MTLAGSCPKCGSDWMVTVPTDKYLQWRGGALIQRVMPDLSAGKRELLLSGICEGCFDKLFREQVDAA